MSLLFSHSVIKMLGNVCLSISIISDVSSRELLSGLVEAVHYGVHGRNGVYHVVKCFIPEEI